MAEKHRVMWSAGLVLLVIAVSMAPFGGAYGADKKEILVGAIKSMTGGNAMTGAEQKWAYEQSVADINKKGGVFVKEAGKKLPIRLIFADDKSRPIRLRQQWKGSSRWTRSTLPCRATCCRTILPLQPCVRSTRSTLP